jgi:site-specific recombinase XerC
MATDSRLSLLTYAALIRENPIRTPYDANAMAIENAPQTRRSKDRVRVLDTHNPAHLYLNRLPSTKSKYTMERALDAIAKRFNGLYCDDIDWVKVERHDVLSVMNALKDNGMSSATRTLYLSAIKGVMEEAYLAEMIPVEQYNRIALIKKPKGSSVQPGKALDVADIKKAFDACEDGTPTGVRDKAILAVLLGSGLRRFECAALLLSDVKFESDELIVTNGKGEKQRPVPIEDAVFRCILEWIDIRGEWPGALFCPIRKGGHIGQKPLADSSIYRVCQLRGLSVDVDSLKPHNLRRTYGTEHDKAGAELSTIAQLLGHSSLNTTRRYIFDDTQAKTHSATLKTGLMSKLLK